MSEFPESADRLTGQDHWETVNSRWTLDRAQTRIETDLDWRSRVKVAWSEYYFWNVLLPRFVKPGGSVVELGTAPGAQTLQYATQFGAEPFGIEYTLEGVAITKENFRRHGQPEQNVIHGDIFDSERMAQYAGSFDAVLSRGLIEHFTEPENAVQAHVRLARPGGLVIISIPTLTGPHYLSAKMLSPHVIPLHNLNIMRRDVFAGLFAHTGLETLWCRCSGGPNLIVGWNDKPGRMAGILQRTLCYVQGGLNLAQHSTGEWPDWPWLHSNLVYVGRKKG